MPSMSGLPLDVDLNFKGCYNHNTSRSPATQGEEEAALQEIERLRDQGKDANRPQLSRHGLNAPSDRYGPLSPRTPLTPLDVKSPRCPSSQSRTSDQSVDWDGTRGKKPFFDICTIRTWFMEMDVERSGHVSKEGFMQFIRNRPQLRRLFIHAGQERYKVTGGRKFEITGKEAEALEIRRLLKLLKEIDQDGNGTLEWEEFLDFWRVAGFLLEYETKNNPREQIAEVLGQIHESHTNGTSDDRLRGQLSNLAAEHLSSQSRRKSQDLSYKPGEAAQKVNRRTSLPCVQAGRMALASLPSLPRTARRKSDSCLFTPRSMTVE